MGLEIAKNQPKDSYKTMESINLKLGTGTHEVQRTRRYFRVCKMLLWNKDKRS